MTGSDHLVLVNGDPDRGIPGDDPGLLLGLTVFETLRTYGATPFRLEAHLDRLEGSVKALGIDMPSRRLIVDEIEANLANDVRIRYTLTAGGNRVLDRAPVDSARICKQMRVAHFDWNPHPTLPGVVKHGSRAAWMVASERLGVDEVLLVDRHGQYLESSRSNLIAAVGGRLVTPALDGRQLAGVTRQAMLDAAERANVELVQSPLFRRDGLTELYCSSTLKQLAPVVAIDELPGPGGGPLGQALLRAFSALVAEECGVDAQSVERLLYTPSPPLEDT